MTKETVTRYLSTNRQSRAATRDRGKAENVGKAYGFFQCNAPQDKITGLLPKIREAVQTPSELELSLTGTNSFVTEDIKLAELARNASHFGMNYVISAKYSRKKNEDVANELSAVINQAYQSPLYSDGEEFHGNIVFEKGRKYVFR